MLSRTPSSWLILSFAFALQLLGETGSDLPGGSGFRTTVSNVVLDVAVTDDKGQPVIGLTKDDFVVAEGGTRQAVAFFEEHTGRVEQAARPAPSEPLNVFSNILQIRPPDSVDVLLLDSLNTPLADQSFVRAQAIKYLRQLPPGTHLAIFLMSTRLVFVQGFTSDPTVLLAALGERERNPQFSPLLKSRGDEVAADQAISQMESLSSGPGSASFQASIDAMKQFLDENDESRTDQRVNITLDNLKQLGRYLAGVPGRKNVVWLSGSFPISILPSDSAQDKMTHLYYEDVKKTAEILAAARVGLYPVDARGLRPSSFYDASTPPSNPGMPESQRQSVYLRLEASQRIAENATMDELALQTGGRAFYNTNGLEDAIEKVIATGSQFYTLTYTPADRKMDGQFRRIDVKVVKGKYKLSYRRGYYADDPQKALAANARELTDPLQTYMGLGMPNFDQIRYKMSIQPTNAPDSIRTTSADFKTKWKGPIINYDMDFAVPVGDLTFDLTPDGVHHGSINLSFVAYDRYGEPICRVSKSVNITVKPELYAAFQQAGMQFRESIELPKGELWLRTGIYDPASARVGTLEIPLSKVIAPPPTGK